jgi:hypothetical protein
MGLLSLQDVMGNPIVQLVGLAITVASLVFAYYSYRKTRPKFELSYSTEDDVLFSGYQYEGSEVDIEFANKKTPRLCRTTVKIKNSGNSLLSASDIVSGVKIFSSAEILACHVLYADSLNSNVSLTQETDRAVKLDFTFLRPGEGAIVDLFHGGDANTISVAGEGRQFRDVTRKIVRRPGLISEGVFAIMYSSVLGLVSSYFLIRFFAYNISISSAPWWSTFGVLFLLPLFALAGLIAGFFFSRSAQLNQWVDTLLLEEIDRRFIALTTRSDNPGPD